MTIETQQVETKNGIWTAYQRGDHVIIVDPQGRSRMRAKGMLNLAILTACLMDEKGPMPEEPNADLPEARGPGLHQPDGIL
jgi:hypothetical protein